MHWTRITALLVIVSMLSACASYESIGIQASPGGDVQLSASIIPGDRVRLVKKSGEVSEFRVVVVEERRISSETMTYELADIESIEVRRAEDEQTVLIALIVVGAVALVVAFANAVEDSVECAISGC